MPRKKHSKCDISIRLSQLPSFLFILAFFYCTHSARWVAEGRPSYPRQATYNSLSTEARAFDNVHGSHEPHGLNVPRRALQQAVGPVLPLQASAPGLAFPGLEPSMLPHPALSPAGLAQQGALEKGLSPWEDFLPIYPSPFNKTPVDALPRNPDFFLGFATAAYQVEGGANDGGRGPTIWDTFTHTSGKVHNNETGDVAVDFYHRFQDDIRIMKSLGIKHFRLSVAWSRIFPAGVGSQPNQQGLDFYSNLVDALLDAGITPYVTLFHWDLPQALQDKYGGWEGGQVVDDFAAYASAVFKALGNRVVWWTTFNEPWTFCFLGYGIGVHAPGVKGESRAAPWVCTYHVLLAHAAAVKAFRALVPGGKISMNINGDWSEPYSTSAADQEAAARHMEFQIAIFGDPLYTGDWPESVKKRVAALPAFTPQQAADILNSTDYYAMNFYTAKFCTECARKPRRRGAGHHGCQRNAGQLQNGAANWSKVAICMAQSRALVHTGHPQLDPRQVASFGDCDHRKWGQRSARS
eukprot:jgi/Botrbrau1/17289/Bobra.0015s0046.1